MVKVSVYVETRDWVRLVSMRKPVHLKRAVNGDVIKGVENVMR